MKTLYSSLESAEAALNHALQFMQTDKYGDGPDCTIVFQALIDISFAKKQLFDDSNIKQITETK